MRFLALHGYGQSAEIIKENMTNKHSLSLWCEAELFFIDGPYILHAKEGKLDGHAWFTFPDNDAFNIPWDDVATSSVSIHGRQESVDIVIEQIKTLKIDALVGFSQGATLAAIVMAEIDPLYRPKFSIHMSGFYLPDIKQVTTPSLHIIGENDEIIKPKYSQMLASCFDNPVTVMHKEKHYIPKDRKKHVKEAIQKFIMQFTFPDSFK